MILKLRISSNLLPVLQRRLAEFENIQIYWYNLLILINHHPFMFAQTFLPDWEVLWLSTLSPSSGWRGACRRHSAPPWELLCAGGWGLGVIMFCLTQWTGLDCLSSPPLISVNLTHLSHTSTAILSGQQHGNGINPFHLALKQKEKVLKKMKILSPAAIDVTEWLHINKI